MFVFFLEIIVAFFFCKAFMIFVRGGRPGGIFEKSEEGRRREIFFFFLFFLNFFLSWTLSALSSNRRRLKDNRLGSNLQKYALKLSFFGF